jgi:hypothetical protein
LLYVATHGHVIGCAVHNSSAMYHLRALRVCQVLLEAWLRRARTANWLLRVRQGLLADDFTAVRPVLKHGPNTACGGKARERAYLPSCTVCQKILPDTPLPTARCVTVVYSLPWPDFNGLARWRPVRAHRQKALPGTPRLESPACRKKYHTTGNAGRALWVWG